MKTELYESRISNARWIAYDLPGNVGWITYCVCAVRLLKQGVTAFSVLAGIPALLMLVGVAELISERIQGLDRILPKHRLCRGFGALTLGGVLGVTVACVGLAWLGGGGLTLWMLAGAALCALFAWLIYREYHRQSK